MSLIEQLWLISIQSTLFIGDTFGTLFCVRNSDSLTPGVIFSQTSIDGDLNFVRNSECL